jgi:DNA (cytosine-5)-methyltransferase 1
VLTFGSLFSGVGGMDLGLERAGLRCVWQCELDEYRRRNLAGHWPDVVRHPDVRSFPPSDPSEWSCDLICGGDPCQANSHAGSVWRRGHEDLAVHFLRIVAAIRPRLVLRENPSKVRPGAPWPWWRFRSGLESLGYAVLPFRLRACCVGADHQRERLFLLAELPDAHEVRLQGFDREGIKAQDAGRETGHRGGSQWYDDLSVPRFRRAADGVPAGLDGYRIKALGDAVCPDVAETIGRFIVEANVPAVSLP